MAGHIALPWRESSPTERPRPATVSPDVLTGLLRHEMEFEGVIVSDALNMAGYTGWARREQRLLEAFNAGVDVMLWPGGQSYFDMMERALEAGTVSMQRLDESVLRILELKARLGLHLPSRDESPSPVQRETIHAGAVKLANAVAEKSITLVRNRSGLLPLDQAKIKRVLVHFSIPESVPANRRDHLEIFVTSLKARGLEVTVLENGNCMDIKNREEAGETWDAYLVIYSLMGHQLKNTLRPTGEMAEVMWTQQNVETLQPITISLCTPYLLYDLPYLDTLVNTYSASPSSMRALDRALFGEINFCEHPPVSAEQEIGTWR
jgi:beta-N-acetylhexosaminidase